ncbi:MAG: hypothetical protein KDD01_23885 [Phaeodactylibacter sp.]|nr:hypothetical protein [Phaeodactylibacter sp.]
MRQFYLAFSILDAARSELSCPYYYLLMHVCNECARGFYQQKAIDSQWNTRNL